MQNWISALRLRTLPLALSTTILGSLLAFSKGSFNYEVFYLAILTTLGLQILSNLANDLGDSEHGVDNENRLGPQRAVQSGAISKSAMRRAVWFTALLTLVSGLALLYAAFGTPDGKSLLFLILGLASIGAAFRYTMGSNPYGYRGLGDLFVLIFFGWIGVGGTFFLHALVWDWTILLPASSIGLFSVGVLNMNNMRDIENDAASGKETLVVRMGFDRARRYHYFLILTGMLTALVYWMLDFRSAWQAIFLLAFAPLFINLKKVGGASNSKSLEPELKRIALSTFLFSLLFGFSFLLLT